MRIHMKSERAEVSLHARRVAGLGLTLLQHGKAGIFYRKIFKTTELILKGLLSCLAFTASYMVPGLL